MDPVDSQLFVVSPPRQRATKLIEAPKSIEARWLLRILKAAGNPPIEFELGWSGERVAAEGKPLHCVRLSNRGLLAGLLTDFQVHFGDAYSRGEIDITGDLVSFMSAVFRAYETVGGGSLVGRIAGWLRRARPNTFYALWLGETMAYTCAYFPTAQATLDQAQVAKMDLVCQKLRIGAGDSVVEAGCGWGGLARHMASKYGAKVRSFNISREQIDYARHRARQDGLERKIEFVEDDYRNIDGHYDVFVSVGMLEHVGRENYERLGRIIRGALNSRGRGLIHSIGRNRPEPLHPWIERRIFPGAYAPSLAEMMRIFEPVNLSVLDVENLRLHYALTLKAWLARFETSKDQIKELSFDEKFIRMWRLYLAGSIAAFETGAMQLFQVVFTTATNNRIPLTRSAKY
jgi:cyclopropane-fatty-acyl-phospholipid synthase